MEGLSEVRKYSVKVVEYDPFWDEANAQICGFRLSEDKTASIMGHIVDRGIFESWSDELEKSKTYDDPEMALKAYLSQQQRDAHHRKSVQLGPRIGGTLRGVSTITSADTLAECDGDVIPAALDARTAFQNTLSRV